MFVFCSNRSPRAFTGLREKASCPGLVTVTKGHRKADGSFRHEGGKRIITGETRLRRSIWKIASDQSEHHPAAFPESLARDHILSWSNEGDTVFDPFSGSGTTLKMARLMGRQGIGVEIHERYCEIAANRLRQKVLF